MIDSIVTADLSKFGFIELDKAAKLLTALANNGAPDDFNTDGLTLNFNTKSGYVFLTNEDFDVLVLADDGTLERFFSCPECGTEGTAGDFSEDSDKCCLEYLANYGVSFDKESK